MPTHRSSFRAGFLCLFFASHMVSGQTSGARAELQENFVVVNAFPGVTFSLPVRVTFLPDGRALVAEKPGTVWVVEDGVKLPVPFINLAVEVESSGDLGLLGMAVDPDFDLNRWVYFGYTVDPHPATGDSDFYSRVERYQADATNPDVVDVSTRQVLIGQTWPEGIPSLSSTHSIGTLRFAPDQTLLVGHGDGGHFELVDSGGHDPGGFGVDHTDPSEDIGAFRARSVNSLSGGILRIDKETGHGLPSNPYWDGDPSSDRSRIWLYGLRNPFRFSLRPGTGSTDPSAGDPGVVYIGDVGWEEWEEFDIATSGGMNFGWPCKEGPEDILGYELVETTAAGNDSVLCNLPTNAETPALESGPVGWWNHFGSSSSNPPGLIGHSVTGGVFYTGTSYPAEWQGRYYIADFIENWIIGYQVDANDNVTDTETFATGSDLQGITDFEIDPSTGDLLFISLIRGEVRRFQYLGASAVDEDLLTRTASPALEIAVRPNPAGQAASVEFEIPQAGRVFVRIFGAAGRLVRTLIEGDELPAGPSQVDWDGRDRYGRSMPPGVYLVQVAGPGQAGSAKVILR